MKLRNTVSIAVVTCILLSVAMAYVKIGAASPSDTFVGAWYSTWYAKTATQVWTTGHGYGSSNQLMGDVSGDGKDDAVVYFSSGSWYAATSTGTAFNSYTQWASGLIASNQLLEDVNGDGKDDAVVYDNGTWTVALSNGSNFSPASVWISGHGVGSSAQLLGDVNGDGKADAIVYFSSGEWYVALSTGSNFGSYTQWGSGFGTSTAKQFLADVNGDGKADAVVYYSDGLWSAGVSNGTSFGAETIWVGGHGSGSSTQMVGDISGDGKADAIVYFSSDALSGFWYAAVSTGSSFGTGYVLQSKYGIGSSKQFISSPSGAAAAQACAFFTSGEWQARCAYFNQYNTWEAWNIKYVPYTLGSYQTYDSGDPDVIDEHLAMLAEAQIDFLIFDETNNLYVDNGYIFNRAKAVAERIRIWNSNSSHRKIRYVIAIGGIQFDNNPATLEYEAGVLYNRFVNTVDGGSDNYFYKDGKPLLVNYCNPSVETIWNNYTGDKTNSDLFTCEWAHTPSEAGTYGWEVRNGSIDDDEVMVVMPGWNNHKDAGYPVVLRNNGVYYFNDCWDRVIRKCPRPQFVIINSFNEYAEDTAIAPTDTSGLASTSEKWYNSNGVIDNNMYWNTTKEYIKQMKGYTASVDYSSVQGTNQWYYQQWTGFVYQNMTWLPASNWWNGSQTCCLVMSNSQHPDTYDSVRKWVAPKAGTVTVKGKVYKQSSGGDGVNVKIKKNSSTVWGTYTIAYNDLIGLTHNFTITVNAGDAIYFIVNKRSNNGFDTTMWDPSIYYQ